MTARGVEADDRAARKAETARAMARRWMIRRVGWAWDEATLGLVRRRYVEDRAAATVVAGEIVAALVQRGVVGAICTRRMVEQAAWLRGWRRADSPLVFRWTPERTEKAKAMYLAGRDDAAIAEELGEGCDANRVKREACRKGWTALLTPAEHAARKTALARRMIAMAHAANRARDYGRVGDRPVRSPGQALAPPVMTSGCGLGDGRTVSPEIRALIDEAVAAGKVVRIAAGTAAGLSMIERALWAAPIERPAVSTASSKRGAVSANRNRELRARA